MMKNNSKDIVIIGAGGFGREVADTIMAINNVSKQYNLLGFIDDDESLKGTVMNGLKVLGARSEIASLAGSKKICAVIAVGSPKMKKKIAEQYCSFVKWENIIHPTAVVSNYTNLGVGNIFQAHTFLGANTNIGNHCTINVGSYVSHDAVLEDYVSIMCQCDVTGKVILREGCYLGSGARVVPQKEIGAGAFLCAGAVATHDVAKGMKVIGNPAHEKII